ncbi:MULTISPECIES: chemotaxis protein CheW [unclassified Paenibacillus]|uniref:chemotaxis protein CheW n=1 Tax=unclassified Paenibacillus TaxID=185978 RepID=UPI001AEB7CC5|nr:MULTISPECIES: chemotaxis protein CheW [unclassified Paenibacillus]MBP1155714.1 purine-binding chemotaxis protein CheW [Paenibacillus sp. PvP091]MBP1168900.1 purine-binding chemotaxis protein CheW [Paenibacillus sp. PvR098]MBP2439928.1 purine-binding chemotaxis protein CheW [Paenibacillus sp. PvP052]
MEKNRDEQYIEVGIGKERYALRIYEIHEIIKMQDITEIPNSLSYLNGVINLRGSIVPIIGLRNRFGLPEKAPTKTTRIVVVNYAEEMVGIVVDQVNQVTSFADIQPPPERIGSVNGSFFAGIGCTDTGLVSILKLEEILRV